MSQDVRWMEGEDVLPCQEVMPCSQMCQRSRWSSLCLPGSGGEAGACFPLSVRNGSALPVPGWGRGGCQGASCQGCRRQHCPPGLDTHTQPSGEGLRGISASLSFFQSYLFNKKIKFCVAFKICAPPPPPLVISDFASRGTALIRT